LELEIVVVPDQWVEDKMFDVIEEEETKEEER
jgi:hypothetical protein